jgi:hypothetical protein
VWSSCSSSFSLLHIFSVERMTHHSICYAMCYLMNRSAVDCGKMIDAIPSRLGELESHDDFRFLLKSATWLSSCSPSFFLTLADRTFGLSRLLSFTQSHSLIHQSSSTSVKEWVRAETTNYSESCLISWLQLLERVSNLPGIYQLWWVVVDCSLEGQKGPQIEDDRGFSTKHQSFSTIRPFMWKTIFHVAKWSSFCLIPREKRIVMLVI